MKDWPGNRMPDYEWQKMIRGVPRIGPTHSEVSMDMRSVAPRVRPSQRYDLIAYAITSVVQIAFVAWLAFTLANTRNRLVVVEHIADDVLQRKTK